MSYAHEWTEVHYGRRRRRPRTVQFQYQNSWDRGGNWHGEMDRAPKPASHRGRSVPLRHPNPNPNPNPGQRPDGQ